MIRVLVVDDSAFARKVVRELLSSHRDIEVVGVARDGLDALEKAAELRPDVMTLDLVMPELDGVGVLQALPKTPDAPRVVLVSLSGAETELGAAGLLAGAVDLVHKPTGLATSRLYEMGEELVAKVRIAATARPLRASLEPLAPQPPPPAMALGTPHVVVVGASTGGPQALTLLLSRLPGSFPHPLAIALHMPPGYTEALAQRLDGASELEVVEADDGVQLRPGRAVLARGGVHLELVGTPAACEARLGYEHALYRPSVDRLFTCAASIYGAATLGVVLTGMGDDGLRGARAIKEAGGRVLAELESSAVVYGMPRVVRENGLADGGAEIGRMADAVQAAFAR